MSGQVAGLVFLCGLLGGATDAPAAEFTAGAYSFSDELGGFRLLSATGSGSEADPVVLQEVFDEATPATLVIRRKTSRLGGAAFASLTLVKVVANRSGRVWAGFELELQERRRRPSSYEDGLSFNQLGAQTPDVSSDSFGTNERLFEPSDRIRYGEGHVDPDATVTFRVTITDPTPVLEFYLVQDPKLLSAGLPERSRFAQAAQPYSADMRRLAPRRGSSGKYW
jgi:hypothetical protein